MKKLSAFLCAIFMTAILCGCGGSGNEGNGGNGGDNEKPTDPVSAEQLLVNEKLSGLSAEEFTYSQLIGMDSLGREVVPTAGINGKYTGIFYCVWLGAFNHTTIYDNTQLLDRYGGSPQGNPIYAKPGSAAYDGTVSPDTAFHYWGEPLYGYYKSSDKWVIRRHMELFMNAGIDFLFLDYSNSTFEYDTAVRALLEVILELQAEGYKNVPKLTFMLPNDKNESKQKLISVYDNWYAGTENRKYRNCWFRADREMNPSGNPMIIGRFTSVTENEYKSNLWLKEMQWPMGMATSADAFPWMEWNSDNSTQPNHNGIMNVSVVQHVNSWSSSSYITSLTGSRPANKYRARGWTKDDPTNYGTDAEKVLSGANIQGQFDNALAVSDDLKMISITGWNEWIAQKVSTYGGSPTYAVFNDCFNYEFSRDAEMMKGGYSDNYYMQIAANVRKFKGEFVEKSDNVALFDKSSAESAGDVSGLKAVFSDIGGDAVKRTDTSVGGTYDYTNSTNRNNIVSTSVGNDGENLYVAISTKDDLKAYGSGDNWMTLYLSCGGKGWENFDFVIGRTPDLAAGKSSIEKFTGTGSKTENKGDAQISVGDKTVLYKIPLSVLGLDKNSVVGIKATDNLQAFGDADDFYISGDCAPLGRLCYAYKIA